MYNRFGNVKHMDKSTVETLDKITKVGTRLIVTYVIMDTWRKLILIAATRPKCY